MTCTKTVWMTILPLKLYTISKKITGNNGVYKFIILSVYRIRPNIPTLKDTEPLLELDRDERKFDIFLTFHRSSLLVSDLKIFLPFTINLDPYLKKVIKGK